MVKSRQRPFFLLPSEIDSSKLSAFLTEQGIGYQRREEIIAKVISAIMYYGQRLKCNLDDAYKAVRKLRKCMPALGSLKYLEFLNAIASAFCKGQPNEDNYRLLKFSELPTTLAMLESAAKENLAEMAKPGFPSLKIGFVRKLKIIWEQDAGKSVGASGEGDFETPPSHFGNFVKLCVGMMPGCKEFETDFGGLLRRVSKPTEKI